jgi:hypothetical protein
MDLGFRQIFAVNVEKTPYHTISINQGNQGRDTLAASELKIALKLSSFEDFPADAMRWVCCFLLAD